MLRLFTSFRRFGARSSVAYGGAHLRRDIGMDDWDGSIGTSHPDRLWPERAAETRPGPVVARPAARLG